MQLCSVYRHLFTTLGATFSKDKLKLLDCPKKIGKTYQLGPIAQGELEDEEPSIECPMESEDRDECSLSIDVGRAVFMYVH